MLLRLAAGLDEPDEGIVERTPATLTVGYLPQEHDRAPGETILTYLARRAGVAEAEADVERHSTVWDPHAYAAALDRFLALGGADFEPRARSVCADLGLPVSLEQETTTLSGGEAARAALAGILLSRFDVEHVEKPHEPWRLQPSLAAAQRSGDLVAALEGAVAVRGSFRLGPIDLDLAPGERVAVTGRNGSGKSTLLALLLGELPPAAGNRHVGRGTVLGALDQRRTAYDGPEPLLTTFAVRTGRQLGEARTLLAKFNLGADHVERACTTLSPGERTRAHLAELMACGVNCLVLDEPTNHLDLEAIEELEAALVAYDGALVVVSHDRRFLEAVAPTRSISL
jgi:ATPase subunit of ABC transporter with duplicated ATPase domains